MKKSLIFMCLCCMLAVLTGCEVKQIEEAEKEPVEFTIVDMEDIPEELLEIIDENKQGEIKLSFEDGSYMYIVRGYGEQKTGGYSIAVNEIYISGEEIFVDTSLIGPPQDKTIREEPSYPYVVIKTKNQGKNVMFK